MSQSQISYLSQSSLDNCPNRHNQPLRKSLPPLISVSAIQSLSPSPAYYNFVANPQRCNVTVRSPISERNRSNSGSLPNNIHESCNCHQQHSLNEKNFDTDSYKTQAVYQLETDKNYTLFKRKQNEKTRPSALKNPKHNTSSSISSSSSFHGVGIPTTIQTAKRTNTASVKSAAKSVYFSPEIEDFMDDKYKRVKSTKDEQSGDSSSK